MSHSQYRINFAHYSKVLAERKKRQLPIGNIAILPNKKVITRSNQWKEPLGIGKCLGITPISKAQRYVPLIRYEGDGVEFMCLGIVAIYTEELYAEIKDLSTKEQWNVLRKYDMNNSKHNMLVKFI